MKRIIISSCILGLTSLSSFTFAAAAHQNMDSSLSSPANVEFTIGALYLQPSSSLLDYAVHGFPFPVQSPHWKVSSVQPDYSAGFDVGFRYDMANSRNDINLTWDHLQTRDSDYTRSDAGEFVVVMYQAGPSAGQNLNNPSQQATATANFNYDVVNLTAGHTLDLTNNMKVRLSAGLSAAQIKQSLLAVFSDYAATFSINNTSSSKFIGIGPQFAVDGSYASSCGFGVLASMSLSALIGTINPITTFISTSPELTSVNYQSISPANATQVVPAFNGKLGFTYKHSFYRQSTVTVALGYEYADYLNAVSSYTPSVVFGNINTGAIALSSLQKSMSNFSVQGPFLNFTFSYA